jgi:hypothetical protein
VKCWVCKRQARGWGHGDTRFDANDPRRHPIDWVFCSARCQQIFHVMYSNWRHVLGGEAPPKEVLMIDPSEAECAAMRRCLAFFGSAAAEVGFDKPLGQYSEAEALRVIDAIVTGYTEAMAAHHEATRFPPVRGMPATADPLKKPLEGPFADMDDDAPWEQATPVATARTQRTGGSRS